MDIAALLGMLEQQEEHFQKIHPRYKEIVAAEVCFASIIFLAAFIVHVNFF